MPLSTEILTREIRKVSDESYILFEGFPKSTSETANRWANIVDIYTIDMIPTSTSRDQAKFLFSRSMEQVDIGTGFVVLKLAFATYANTLSLGMNPTFTGIAPVTPILLETVAPIGLGGGSAKEVAIAMANIIQQWFKTGVAINTSSGASINWN